MAKVRIAYAVGSDESFGPEEINDPARYACMTAHALVDENDAPLAAVRRQGAPHFRRLGKEDAVRLLPRAHRSERHTKTINDLLRALRLSGREIRIFTNVWEEDGSANSSEQTLFSYRAGASFDWFTEHTIQFDDLTRIQPDISGRYATTMAPSGRSPAVIIEVVDTHFPELETFEKLMSLSRTGHQIYFFILGKFPLVHAQRLNKFTIQEDVRLDLRITWALLKGQLVRNGVVQSLEGDDAKSRSRHALAIIEKQAAQSRG